MNLAQRLLRNRRRNYRLTNLALAREIGVTHGFIGRVLSGEKKPGPRVLEYLGLEAYEAYRRRRQAPTTAPE